MFFKSFQISSIGLPTNVLHHGHAASMQEAQNVIEKLIRGESVDASLPQPLMPNNGRYDSGKLKRIRIQLTLFSL